VGTAPFSGRAARLPTFTLLKRKAEVLIPSHLRDRIRFERNPDACPVHLSYTCYARWPHGIGAWPPKQFPLEAAQLGEASNAS